MLTRLNKILLGALVVQAILVVYLVTRSGPAKLVETQVLPGFDSASVTRVQVLDGTKSVDLVKQGNDWIVASGFNYPADAQKVTSLLAPIAKMTSAEPVTTSSGRHKQLKVADTEFERKLVLTAGGKDITIFVGTSAGLRRTAVRLGGDERVWGVAGVSTGTMSTQNRDWVKPNYYDIPRDDVTKVTITKGTSSVDIDVVPPPAAGSGSAPPPPASSDFKLAFDGTPLVLAPGESLDKFAIDTIISNVSSISAAPADPKRAGTPTATVVVVHKGVTDTLDITADGESFWVKQRGVERATTVDKDRLKAVVEAARDKLVTKPEPKAGSGSGSGMPIVPPTKK